MFSICFKGTVEVKGFWGHSDETSSKPAAPAVAEACKPKVLPSAAAGTTTAPEMTALALWKMNVHTAKSLLTQKIPSSALMMIHSKTTVKEHWDVIVEEYTEKGPTHSQTTKISS
ncbi:hypothetical protein H0H92_015067 [Tricholoma furcatifolium]|nr:hypothetical protein H0H92_015067 [Tricholoma furcatifolium]